MGFIPSTVRLLTALGKAAMLEREDSTDPRDQYVVWSALKYWGNDLYGLLGAERHSTNIWPASNEQIEAMKASLQELKNGYAASGLAFVLVRCGYVDDAVIASLNPWYRQLFFLSRDGYSASDVYNKLNDIGMAGLRKEEGIAELDRALSDPAGALGWYYPGRLLDALFDGRIFEVRLEYQSEDPDYEKLLSSMVNQAGLAEIVTEIKQSFDESYDWFLAYLLDGQTERVKICNMNYFSGLCDRPVMDHFNELLNRLDKPERVFRFGGGGDDQICAYYIVASAPEFTAVCDELYIPVQ